MQDLADSGYLQTAGFRHQLHARGVRYAEAVARTFGEQVQRYFVDPLDDGDMAALTRI